MTTINDESDWISVAASSSSTPITGSLIINSDIPFTDQRDPIHLGDNAVVDGKCNTLYLHSNVNAGLFIFPTTGLVTSSISNLYINANSYSLNVKGQSFLLYNDLSFDFQRGNLTNVHVVDGELNFASGLLSSSFGDNTGVSLSLIKECSVSNISITDGGGFGEGFYNTNFESCYSKSTLIDNAHGFVQGLIDGECTVTNCYSLPIGQAIPNNCCGMFGVAASGTLTFNSCYVYGNLEDSANSTAGFLIQCGLIDQLSFNNCYFACDTVSGSQDSNIGGFVAFLKDDGSPATINITNCYSQNTPASFIGVSEPGYVPIINITNSHINSTGAYISTVNNATDNILGTSDLDLNTAYNGTTLPASWSPTVWSNSVSSFLILKDFQNLNVWDGTYTTYRSGPDYSSFLCNPCFAYNTFIKTKDGVKFVQDLVYGDVVGKYKVDYVLKTKLPKKYAMVKISKNSINGNKPTRNLYVTPPHLFKINKKLITANKLCKMYPTQIYKVAPTHKYVYHIVLQDGEYGFISVSGLLAETFTLDARKH